MSDLLVIPIHQELEKRIFWMIRLRWLGAAAAFLLVWVTNGVLPQVLPLGALMGVIGGVLAYNLALYLHARRLSHLDAAARCNSATTNTHVQITLDLLTLTLLLHFSGGLENPFIFFYVLHIITSSILLSKKDSFIYAGLAILLTCGMLVLEAGGVIPHYNLKGYRLSTRYTEPLHIVSISASLSSVLLLTAYFASSIMEHVRAEAREMSHVNAELAASNLACELRTQELTVLNEQLATSNLACELRTQELTALNEQLAASNLACELRTQELAAMNERLKELDDARMQFTLLVTHELRAPVAAIHSYIKLILDGYVPPEKQREILERSEQRAREQLDLIADLLELGKIQQKATREQKEAVAVDYVLDGIAELMRSYARDKGVGLNIEVAEGVPPVTMIANHVKQLWINLISNGIKYTPAGGQVTISLTQDGRYLIGTVQDTGIGISPQDCAHIFQDFYRTDTAKAMERHGTGLGLSIVKRIIEIYGGQIRVQSAVGQGTRFTFLLPLQPDFAIGKENSLVIES